MIECKNVKVKYGKKEVLHSVAFTAEPSHITVILGKNGCGKSTLLRAMSGLIPYDGSIVVDGKEIRSIEAARRALNASNASQSRYHCPPARLLRAQSLHGSDGDTLPR